MVDKFFPRGLVDTAQPAWYWAPMARPLRVLRQLAVYHRTNRGMARQPAFRTAAGRQAFLAGVAAARAALKPRVNGQEIGEK